MVTLKQQNLKKEIERAQAKRDDALARMLKAADAYRKYDRTAKLLYNRLLKCRRDLRAAVAQVHDGQEPACCMHGNPLSGACDECPRPFVAK